MSPNRGGFHLQIEDKVWCLPAKLTAFDLRIPWIWYVNLMCGRYYFDQESPITWTSALLFPSFIQPWSLILTPHPPPFVNECTDGWAFSCIQLDLRSLPCKHQSLAHWWTGDFLEPIIWHESRGPALRSGNPVWHSKRPPPSPAEMPSLILEPFGMPPAQTEDY